MSFEPNIAEPESVETFEPTEVEPDAQPERSWVEQRVDELSRELGGRPAVEDFNAGRFAHDYGYEIARMQGAERELAGQLADLSSRPDVQFWGPEVEAAVLQIAYEGAQRGAPINLEQAYRSWEATHLGYDPIRQATFGDRQTLNNDEIADILREDSRRRTENTKRGEKLTESEAHRLAVDVLKTQPKGVPSTSDWPSDEKGARHAAANLLKASQ